MMLRRDRQYLYAAALAGARPSRRGGDLCGLRARGLDDLPIQAGDHIWTPPGGSHVLHAETEVVIHVTLPGPVVLTE